MRNKFVLIIIFTFQTISSQWIKHDNPETESQKSFNKVQFVNEQDGFILYDIYSSSSDGGTYLMRTHNSGLDWESNKLNSLYGIRDIYFSSKNIGFYVALIEYDIKVYKTVDGGYTWSEKFSKGIDDYFYLNSIDFFNDNIGCIVGSKFIYTNNGGDNWQISSNKPPDLYSLQNVKYIDQDNAVAVGQAELIMKSSNGGKNWKVVSYTQNGYLDNVVFVSDKKGFAYADEKYFSTVDAGESWVQKNMPISSFGTSDAFFADQNNGWLVCAGGAIIKISSSSWIKTQLVDHPNLTSIYFIDNNRGWAVGESSFLLTKDGGVTWENQYFPKSKFYSKSFFINNQKGWIVGYEGTILHTEDYGISWNYQESNSRLDLVDIDFTAENNGFIVGKHIGEWWEYGTEILKTTDGGSHWELMHSSSWYSLNSLDMYNDNFGLAVGDAGTILTTTDGGHSWKSKFINTNNLLKVQIIDSTLIFIGGADGYLYKSLDAGKTWVTNRIRNSYEDIIDIKFFNSSDGWVLGDWAFIGKTTDGGTSWVNKRPYPNDNIYSITSFDFVDEQTGWICWNQKVLKTNDGGDTWGTQYIETNTYDRLISIFMLDKNSGWGVGYNSIYSTSNGGGITGVEEELQTFTEFELSQNYPNPFNPTTQISYQIPNGSVQNVILKVYDILGKEVATLVNEKQSPGNYQVEFDGSNLPSGVYFYRLQTGDFSETKKMILLR